MLTLIASVVAMWNRLVGLEQRILVSRGFFGVSDLSRAGPINFAVSRRAAFSKPGGEGDDGTPLRRSVSDSPQDRKEGRSVLDWLHPDPFRYGVLPASAAGST